MTGSTIGTGEHGGYERRRGVVLRLLALVNVAMVIFIVATSHNGIDRNGFLLGTDFLSFWTTGRMLHAGENPYDVAAHIASQREFYASGDGFTAFFYPPLFLPFCWVLGLFNYFTALAAWLLTTGALLWVAVRLWFRRLGVSEPLWLYALALPAATIAVTHGQTAFLVAAMLGLGVLWVDRRPWLAGLCFGIAAIKPQLGVLVPLVLVLTGQWRVIAAAGLAVLLLGVLSTAAFGVGIWNDWRAIGDTASGSLSSGSIGFTKMVSTYTAGRLLGASSAVAGAMQAFVSIGVVVSLGWVAWRRGWSIELGAAMLAGSVLVTPFVLDYDLVVLAFPLALFAVGKVGAWERAGAATAFIGPQFARPLALEAGVPLMPPILIGFFALVLRRACAAGQPRS